MWLSMQTWYRPIHNSTIKSFSNQVYVLDFNVNGLENRLFSFVVSLPKWLATFLLQVNKKEISKLNIKKLQYLPQYCPNIIFNDIVVNWELTSLHEQSLSWNYACRPFKYSEQINKFDHCFFYFILIVNTILWTIPMVYLTVTCFSFFKH